MIIQKKANDEINLKNDLSPLIIKYSDIIFPELTDILNIIFSCGNDNFEGFTVQFVEKYFTIRIIKKVIEILIEQNQIEGIIPFLKASFQAEFSKILKGTNNKKKVKAIAN